MNTLSSIGFYPDAIRLPTWRERWLGPIESGGMYVVALVLLGGLDIGLWAFIVSRLLWH